ncbi:MAG TPA: hypothetical protein VMU17_05515 [Elusimicrobiota bacterium]|nr:hypothetical protein [Elusimicrobiota bacterium]
MNVFTRPAYWLVFAGLLVAGTSALRDILILSHGAPLYAISGADTTSFDENYQFAPLAVRCTWRNLFPADAYGSLRRSEITSFPYLVIWTESAFYHLTHSLSVALLTIHTLSPLVTYLAAFLIFRRFFDPLVATILAFYTWAFMSQSGLGLFVHALAAGGRHFWPAYRDALPSIRSLVSSRFPSPGTSLALFLLWISFTLPLLWNDDAEPVSLLKAGLLGLAWGVQAYVYYPNFLIGCLYLMSLLVIRYARGRNRISPSQAMAQVLCAAAGIAFAAAPTLARALGGGSAADHDLLIRTGLHTRPEGAVLYMSALQLSAIWIPWAALAIFALWNKRGVAQSVRRCAPLIILIPLCILGANSFFVTGYLPQPDRLIFRVAIFLFVFNACPLIDFLWRSLQPKHPGLWHAIIAGAIGMMPILCALKAKNQIQAAMIYRRYAVPELARIDSSLRVLSRYAKPDETIVSADYGLDYSLPTFTPYNTLIVNGLTARLTDEEIMKRLALFGKVLGMPRQAFVHYMEGMPVCAPPLTVFRWGAGADCLFNQPAFERMGYLQVHHMNESELGSPAYEQHVADIFDRIDVVDGVQRYNLSVIHSQRLPKSLESLYAWRDRTPDGNNVYVREMKPI